MTQTELYACVNALLALLGGFFLLVILPPLPDSGLVEAAAPGLVVVGFLIETVDKALLRGFIPDFRLEVLAVLVLELVVLDVMSLAGRLLGGRPYITYTLYIIVMEVYWCTGGGG